MIPENESKLRSVYGTFKSISDALESKSISVSPKFWKTERENILKVIAEGKR